MRNLHAHPWTGTHSNVALALVAMPLLPPGMTLAAVSLALQANTVELAFQPEAAAFVSPWGGVSPLDGIGWIASG